MFLIVNFGRHVRASLIPKNPPSLAVTDFVLVLAIASFGVEVLALARADKTAGKIGSDVDSRTGAGFALSFDPGAISPIRHRAQGPAVAGRELEVLRQSLRASAPLSAGLIQG